MNARNEISNLDSDTGLFAFPAIYQTDINLKWRKLALYHAD